MDPGVFANSLMEQVKAQADGTEASLSPVDLMSNAYATTLQRVEYGSSTCCVATLRPDGILEVRFAMLFK